MIKRFTIASMALSIVLMANPGKKVVEDNCPGIFQKNIAYFADEHDPHNRLLVFDYKNMELLDEIPIEGSLNHHADLAGTIFSSPYIITVAKGSNFISFYNIKNGEFVKKIRLPFRPRSADAFNKRRDLIFLNSRDRPAGVLIDAKKLMLVGKLGFNIDCNKEGDNIFTDNEIKSLVCSTNDFGGDQISGHPIWLDDNSVALLDRANRYIHVFKIHKKGSFYKTKRIQSIPTDTSLHQMIPLDANDKRNKVFYGETESNIEQQKYAGVYKFTKKGHQLKVDKFTYFKYEDIIGVYGHNLYITPDKKYLYAPAGATINSNGDISKGGIFVIDAKTLNVINFIPTGFGAGHVAFAKNKGLAFVTNHKDSHISVLNWKEHKFIKDIEIPFRHEGIASILLSHSQYIDKEENYYYNVWTDGGDFFRINLDTLEIDGEIRTGGIPIQGNFVPNVTTACNIPKPADIDGYDILFGDFNDEIRKIKDYIRGSDESNDYDDSRDFLKDLNDKVNKLREAKRLNWISKEEYHKYLDELRNLKREYWRMIKGLD